MAKLHPTPVSETLADTTPGAALSRVSQVVAARTGASEHGAALVRLHTGQPGRVLGGKYRLISLLGRGGMGEVWRAEHVDLRSTVALKLIDVDLLESGNAALREHLLARFLREARAAASLQSPHVVRVFDTGVDHGVPFIAMEMLEGETLAERLVRQGCLTFEETLRVITHVGRAMTEAHDRGITHRDLKPDNIFIVQNDDEEVAKVLDFGIAKVRPSQLDTPGVATVTGNLIGTPAYMSPEQAGGTVAVDGRSDLWTMGVVAYECLTGNMPFASQHVGELVLEICVKTMPVPSQVAPVSLAFDAWWSRACCRNRDERFQSARELCRALASLSSDPAVSAPFDSLPPGPEAPTTFARTTSFRPPARLVIPGQSAPTLRAWHVLTAAVFVLALTVSGATFFVRSPHAEAAALVPTVPEVTGAGFAPRFAQAPANVPEERSAVPVVTPSTVPVGSSLAAPHASAQPPASPASATTAPARAKLARSPKPAAASSGSRPPTPRDRLGL